MIVPKTTYWVVCGPTASGKSNFSMNLAEKFGGELVICDAVQIYQGLDMGSGKESLEERRGIPHHLVSAADPLQPWDAALYAQRAREAIKAIGTRGKIPIVVAGSGLYLRALWGYDFHLWPSSKSLRTFLQEKGEKEDLFSLLARLDPERAQKLGRRDKVRLLRSLELILLTGQTHNQRTAPPPENLFPPEKIFFLNPPRAELHEAINNRVAHMLAKGWIQEVQNLLASGVPENQGPLTAIGYREICLYLRGEIPSKDILEEKIRASTRQYAKRQITWFKTLANQDPRLVTC